MMKTGAVGNLRRVDRLELGGAKEEEAEPRRGGKKNGGITEEVNLQQAGSTQERETKIQRTNGSVVLRKKKRKW